MLLNVAMIQCREIITPQPGAYVYVLYSVETSYVTSESHLMEKVPFF